MVIRAGSILFFPFQLFRALKCATSSYMFILHFLIFRLTPSQVGLAHYDNS